MLMDCNLSYITCNICRYLYESIINIEYFLFEYNSDDSIDSDIDLSKTNNSNFTDNKSVDNLHNEDSENSEYEYVN